jgi:hypothetical protein
VEEEEAKAEALADAEAEREAEPLAETLCVLLPLCELLPETLPLADGLCELLEVAVTLLLWEPLALADALSLLLGLLVRLPDGELLCVAPELPETVEDAVAVGVLLSELVADELAVCISIHGQAQKSRLTAALKQRAPQNMSCRPRLSNNQQRHFSPASL